MSCTVEVVLLCDVAVRSTARPRLGPGWTGGPYPHRYEDHLGRTITTDAAARATNFPASLAPQLFGRQGMNTAAAAPDAEVRAHRDLSVVEPPAAVADALRAAKVGRGASIRLHYAEILMADVLGVGSRDARRPAVVALHLSVGADKLDHVIRIVGALARDRGPASAGALRGGLAYTALQQVAGLGDDVELPTAGSGVEGGVYPLILADRESRWRRLSPQREELFRVAALQSRAETIASADRMERALDAARELSVSWSMLALRNGAAFQLHLAEDDGFRAQARIYFRTLYTDAVMLAWLQDAILRSWERAASETLAALADRSDLGPARQRAADLDRAVAVDSLRYWMKRSAANTGRAISVLHDVQAALELDRRLATVEEQIATLARLADRDSVERQTRAQEGLSTVAMVFAVAVFPITVTNDVVSLLGLTPSPGTIVPVLLGLVAVCGLGAYGLRRALLRDRR